MRLLISIMLLTVCAFAQKTTYMDGTDCQCDSISTNSFGTESSYKNGKLNGISKVYYESGNLEFDNIYINGKNTKTIRYYESGSIRSSKCDSIHIEYYENGALKVIVPYKNGMRHGIAVGYYENGSLRDSVSYKDGIQDGIEYWYRQSGELIYIRTFKNGKLQGFTECSNGMRGNISFYCNEF